MWHTDFFFLYQRSSILETVQQRKTKHTPELVEWLRVIAMH